MPEVHITELLTLDKFTDVIQLVATQVRKRTEPTVQNATTLHLHAFLAS